MNNALVNTEHKLTFHKAFDGPQRVFFVGEYLFDKITRMTSHRIKGQKVKTHGNWHFVLVEKFEPGMVAEIPAVSWFKEGRTNGFKELIKLTAMKAIGREPKLLK